MTAHLHRGTSGICGTFGNKLEHIQYNSNLQKFFDFEFNFKPNDLNSKANC